MCTREPGTVLSTDRTNLESCIIKINLALKYRLSGERGEASFLSRLRPNLFWKPFCKPHKVYKRDLTKGLEMERIKPLGIAFQ